MDGWRRAARVQERRFWSTLVVVGVLLSLTLLSSLLLTAGGSGDSVSVGFYVQQGVLLAASAVGTALAVRRWRRARV